MHKFRVIVSAAVLAVLAASGCSSDDSSTGEGFADRQVVADFAHQVVVPTYALLATRQVALDESIAALATDKTAASFNAAREAWIAARMPWEQSEAFLFGPVDSFGYDPAMDSWPVNKTDLDAVLASGEPFSAQYVAGLEETLKGFHTLEYLLFGEGRAKTVEDLTSRELEYLKTTSAELAEVGEALHSEWTRGVAGRRPYRDVFATAGLSGNPGYRSLSSAAQEIVSGMIKICDEVANGKIADPYDARDPTLVESQFAFNSIADFQDNLRSVHNTYTGGVPAASSQGRGLSAFIAARDPRLDERLLEEIQAAIDAIGAIPSPFRDAISSSSASDAIEAAQASIRKVQTTLERDVQPLLL